MESLTIDILNPKAGKLLQDLADLDLIAIRNSSKIGLSSILDKLQSKPGPVPTMEEITQEVESVRAKRYANKG